MKNKDINKLLFEASNGNILAKMELGFRYYHGFNVDINKELAYKIWGEVANQGEECGIVTLGSVYLLEDKSKEAEKILLKGVDIKSGEACFLLSTLYHEQKLEKYLQYLDLACLYNYPEAIITKAMVENDVNKKIELLKSTTHPYAHYELGLIYMYHKEYTDYKKAITLLKNALKYEVFDAIVPLTYAYLEGLGINKNPNEAFRLLKLGIDKKIPDCYYNLGIMYLDGNGIKANPKEAFKYFKIASDTFNHIDSKYNIALMYLNGLGVKKDTKEGERLLDYCIKQNYQLAINYKTQK